jgi:hypothetical protein
MKKSLLTVIAILSVCPFISQAQTNTFPSSGNVGIGTTSPIGKLELNDGNGTGVIAYFGANGTTNAKGLYFSRPSVNTNPVNIQGTMSGVGATIISLQAEGGNVGIGTTSPLGILGIGNQSKVVSTSGVTLGSDNSTVEFVGSTFGSGYGHKIYAVDPSNGAVDLRIAVRQGTTSWTDALTIRSNTGNVGIGTTSPGYRLDVYNAGAGSALNVTGSAYGTRNDTGIDFSAHNSVNATYGRIGLQISNAGTGAETGGLTFSTVNSGSLSEKMFISASGKVGIGTTVPDQLLTVKGTIHSQEVKVDMNVPGPDYVFEPTYKLPSLAEVKAFINKNHHLSEIPSAAEMAKNGLDLGDMNIKLLKKVEELTLHLIEKEEELKDQREKLNKMQLQINALIEKTGK